MKKYTIINIFNQSKDIYVDCIELAFDIARISNVNIIGTIIYDHFNKKYFKCVN